MTFVVTDNCIKCKYTDCVEVCPVDAFHQGPNFLVINPDECIDCTLCEPECPINAIYPEDDVPAGQEGFVALNAERRRGSAGRPELAKPPYARRENGTVILVLRRDKDCKHLQSDNKCDIYPIRPDACSMFPAGSECCLSSREEELGVLDGAPA